MTPNEIRGGLQVDPFSTRVWFSEAQQEWVIEWHTTSADYPEQAALGSFRETGDGIEWLRFFVREPFRRQGIYTQALRWSLSLGVKVTAAAASSPQREWDGFRGDGVLKLDKRSAKARVKVR